MSPEGTGATLAAIEGAGRQVVSHAALVKDGLFFFVVLLALLLVMFLYAVIRAPLEAAGPASRPAPEPPTPPRPDHENPIIDWPRPWPPGGTMGQPDDGYVGRHANPHGPPWEPAPKPPGLDW